MDIPVEESGIHGARVDIGDPKAAALQILGSGENPEAEPCLRVEYTADPGTPSFPARLATFTTHPPGLISSAAARVSTMGAARFAEHIVANFSGGCRSMSPQ
ncbi:MAG: hypothetical protein RMJ98_04395 [Myxococcales bacterium]|nr:hypothetical protein [Polyangiaceae bacterium]MDW8248531.1 hypothetical protein [Myxococcales bacterium]